MQACDSEISKLALAQKDCAAFALKFNESCFLQLFLVQVECFQKYLDIFVCDAQNPGESSFQHNFDSIYHQSCHLGGLKTVQNKNAGKTSCGRRFRANYRVSNTCVQMPDSGLFRAFRLVFWVVSRPTRPLRNPRTEQNCLRPRKRHSMLQTVFYLALEIFLFRSVMKLLGFSRIDAPDEVFVETPRIEHP